jgi:hypothetical protein
LFPHLIFAADFLQYGDALCVGPCLPIGKVVPLLVQVCFFIDFGDIFDHKGIVTWAIKYLSENLKGFTFLYSKNRRFFEYKKVISFYFFR